MGLLLATLLRRPARRGTLALAGTLGFASACVQVFEIPAVETGSEDTGDEAVNCFEGETVCDAACVNLDESAANCGACGEACGSGELCVDAVCLPGCTSGCSFPEEFCDEADGVCRCRAGLSLCDGECVELLNDPAHCGACGNDCAPGEVCDSEVCRDNCVEFQDQCEDLCTQLEVDPMNCGVCGVACDPDELCFDGDCLNVNYFDEDACNSCPCTPGCDVTGGGVCCESEYLALPVCVLGTAVCPP